MQAYNEDGRLTSTLEEGVYEVIQIAIPYFHSICWNLLQNLKCCALVAEQRAKSASTGNT